MKCKAVEMRDYLSADQTGVLQINKWAITLTSEVLSRDTNMNSHERRFSQ